MAFTAVELGHDYLVLTDHSPRLTVAHGLSAERLARQLDVVDAVNDHLGGSFTLLKGIEVDILDDGGLDQTDEMLARLQVRVASVHSKLKMEPAQMTQRMIGAIRNPFMNVLGHCTGRLVTGNRGVRPGSRFDAEAVFTACVENDVAVEINSRPERRDPPTAAPRARARPRLPLLDRLRLARARPARHARLRLPPRGGGRHRAGPDRQHLGARPAPRVGGEGIV